MLTLLPTVGLVSTLDTLSISFEIEPTNCRVEKNDEVYRHLNFAPILLWTDILFGLW